MTLQARRLRGAWRFARSGQGRLAVGIVLLEFVAAVQTFISSTLLPVIETSLHAQRQLGLLIAGSTIGMFIALPVASRAITRFGLSRLLLAALSGYLCGTVVAVTAHHAAIFAVGGLMQGTASGLLAVFGLSAVIRFFDPGMRARLIAISSAMWIAPAVAGPPIALGLEHLIGWRWTLLTPFPLLVLGRVLTARAVLTDSDHDHSRARHGRPIGITLLVPAGVTLLVAGSSGGPWPLAPIGIAAALIGASRLLPAGTVRARRGTPAAMLVMLLFAAGYFGAGALVTVLITTKYGGSLTAAGIALTGGGLGWSLASLIVPRVAGQSQERVRPIVTSGLALTAAGVAVMAAPGHGAAVPITAWVIASVGVGFAYPALYLFCTKGPPAGAEDLAAAVLIAESFGALLGRSLGAGIASTITAAGVAPSAGLDAAYAVFAAALVTGIAASTRLASGGRRAEPRGAGTQPAYPQPAHPPSAASASSPRGDFRPGSGAAQSSAAGLVQAHDQ